MMLHCNAALQRGVVLHRCLGSRGTWTQTVRAGLSITMYGVLKAGRRSNITKRVVCFPLFATVVDSRDPSQRGVRAMGRRATGASIVR